MYFKSRGCFEVLYSDLTNTTENWLKKETTQHSTVNLNGKILIFFSPSLIEYLQLNLCFKLLFLYQLTHIWRQIVHENCKLRIPAEHVVYTNYWFCFVLTFRTILVHNMFRRCCELLKKIYLYCFSVISNLSDGTCSLKNGLPYFLL